MVTACCNLRMNDLAKIRRENLASLVAEYGLTSVAKRMKRSMTQINDTVAGRKSFGEKVARAMEREWDATLPSGWLDLPISGIPHPAHTLSNVTQLRSKKSEEIIIRQYETGGAMGNGLELRDQPGVIHSWSVNPEWLQKNVRAHTSAKNLCIVTGFGDSMRPMFNPGDPLIVDIGIHSVDFDAVYFFRVANEGFIKRLQRVPGKGILAISENGAYRDWVIEPSMDFEVFGRVLKVWCSEDF